MNRSFAFLFVLSISLFVFFSAGAQDIPGMKRIPLDDSSKFNWTNPDLFRWKLILGKDLKDHYIDDREGIALRAKGWVCLTSKTQRSTWSGGSKPRFFKEYRTVVCHHGKFKALIEVSCKLGIDNKKTTLVHADSSWLEIGTGPKLQPIGLACETWYDENSDGKHENYEWKSNMDHWSVGLEGCENCRRKCKG